MGTRLSGCKRLDELVVSVIAAVVCLVGGMNMSFQTGCRTDTRVSVRQVLE
jgi:hypothetical protein